MARILIVDDEPSIRETLTEFLADEGYEVLTADSVAAATEQLEQGEIDVVVSDIVLPQTSGLELLRRLAEGVPRVKVILITGEPSYETAAEGLRHGAFDYLSKPVRQAAIKRVVGAAVRMKALEDENRRYQERLEELVDERTRQIREYSERLRGIADRTRRFARCSELGDLAPCVLSTLAETMGAEGGSFFRKRDGYLELLVALDPEHQPRRIDLPLPEGSVLSSVVEGGDGLVVQDLARRPELQPSGWAGYHNGSLLALRCVDSAGELIGIVTLHNKRRPPFTEEDLDLGRIIAAHTVEALRGLELNRRLRASEQQYRALSERSLTGIALIQDGALVYGNPRLAEILGYAPHGLAALVGRSFLDALHPDSREAAATRLLRRLRGEETTAHELLRVQRPDGEEAWIEALGNPVEHEGRPALLINVVDATARQRAEAERARLEAQFLQAQKMEAIGRLAGGVAHDFNNILMAIFGYTDLVLEKLGEGHPCWLDVREVRLAAERAAALTRQLLAFSRRQVREPRVLDLNAAVSASQKMLCRLIGEDVTLSFAPDASLRCVMADPTQIDQILVNLVTNARDAMPRGGTLTIETRARPGRPEGPPHGWVVLSVSDTGCGMDEDLRARVFEPFFTTKERGTGLGLATVRSIAEQDGGRVELESTPGHGTVVRILFVAVGPEQPLEASGPAVSERPQGGAETILLAEDEPAVRQLALMILTGLGYKVLEARSGDEALRLAAERPEEIDLLVSDVILPGKSGPEVLVELRARRPRIKQLFISGYAEDVVGPHGVLAPGVRLLQKPFSVSDLARAVREALDA